MDYAIIAAGEGSRLVEEGVTTPKPLVRLLGEPMIDRLMGLFLRHGATSISVIVNEEMADVQRHMEQLALPVPLRPGLPRRRPKRLLLLKTPQLTRLPQKKPPRRSNSYRLLGPAFYCK